MAHRVIDSTVLKVFGEGELKVKKYGKEWRCIWRKLHLAVNANIHEIICTDLSMTTLRTQKPSWVLSDKLTEKSRQQRQAVLTIPDSTTMNCDLKNPHLSLSSEGSVLLA